VDVPVEVALLERRQVLSGSPAPQIQAVASMLGQLDNQMANKLSSTNHFLSSLSPAERNSLDAKGTNSPVYKDAQSLVSTLDRELPSMAKARTAAGREVLRLTGSATQLTPAVKSAAEKFLQSAERFDSLYSKLQADKNALDGLLAIAIRRPGGC
jgi:hypothetical protein